jgi:predicted transcriptional regulator
MTTTMGVKMDETTRDRLKLLSAAKQRSAHWLMREAIRGISVNKEEKIENRNQKADAAWVEYQRTGKFVGNEAVTAWLDTWGTDKES